MTARWAIAGLVGLMLAATACAADQSTTTTISAPATSPTSLTTTSAADATTTAADSPTTTTSTDPPTTTTTTAPLPPLQGLALEEIGAGFDRPTYVTAPLGDGRLFVVERAGTVRIVDDAGETLPEPFLDIREEVLDSGIEQGLLGLSFHPDYASNGLFFASYTGDGGHSRIVEYQVSGDPNRAEADSGREILFLSQPTDRHNGGMVLFGPDGYLYLGLGEGGQASAHAQNPETLLSAILRLDIDGGDPYRIPPDNPFVAGGGAPEVIAYGLRNPWRFAIDDGLLYIADVGHSDWEEVDVVPLDGGPYNFGWLIMEGSHCFSSAGCDQTGLVLPVLEYGHDEGCSITGGFVYRGREIPELDGHYFYADWCSGLVRSFRYDNGTAVDQQDWSDDLAGVGQINSFGVDAAGELYVATWEGMVARIVPVR